MGPSLWLLASAAMVGLAAGQGGDMRDPYGMEHFVTRPELIAPKLMIAKHHAESITPGYWFVTPYYVTNQRQREETKEYIPCQTGAHIYDGDGQLIWSGACRYDNRNIFAFQPVDINGVQHLSFWLGHQFIGDPATIPKDDVPASAVLLNNNYEEVQRVFQHPFLDCHEVSFQPDGKSVLVTRLWKEKKDLKQYNRPGSEVLHGSFREIDIATNEPIFDWDPPANNVTLDESCDKSGKGSDVGDAWDYFHINSIDKNQDGDYLISARHTSTIYKISGQDGHIMWRLGGYYSDFVMEENLPFHWQHHASLLFENSTHAIVSVFDNAGDDFGRNPDIPNEISAGKIMLLDTASTPMTAKMLRRFDRPDGKRSPMGGSVFLANGHDPLTSNVLVNWVIPGYFSEYDGRDRLVLEGRFQSEGIKTYRALKAEFVGHPTEPIAFKTFPIAYSEDDVASAFYVSWNGATEVTHWAFYGSDSETGSYSLLKKVKKQGFETSWVMPGVVQYAYVEALDKDGNMLRASEAYPIQALPELHGKTQYQVTVPVLEDARKTYGEGALTFSDAEFTHANPIPLHASPNNEISDLTGGSDMTGGALPGSHSLSDVHHPSSDHFIPPPVNLEKTTSQQLDSTSGLIRPADCPKAVSTPAAQQPAAAYIPRDTNGAAQLVVDAFAVFGLFSVARALQVRLLKRRKAGYGSPPGYYESPE